MAGPVLVRLNAESLQDIAQSGRATTLGTIEQTDELPRRVLQVEVAADAVFRQFVKELLAVTVNRVEPLGETLTRGS